MLIGIYDIDYFCSKKTWNYDCMKISSYHKQLGDKVFLIETPMDLQDTYDLLYICRQSSVYPLPAVRFWGNKSRIFGNCNYMNNWEVPTVILACRPDYELYKKFEHDYWYHSNGIQLFDEKGKILPKFQNPDNAYKNKRNLVIDTSFWKSSKEDKLKALSYLKDKKNISFLYPISLKSLFSDEEVAFSFSYLDLSKNAQLVWLFDDEQCASNYINYTNKLVKLMFDKSANIGTVITDYSYLDNLLLFCGLGRTNGFFVDIKNKLNDSTIESDLVDKLVEYQKSRRKNISFIDYIVESVAIAKGMNPFELFANNVGVGPIISEELNFLGIMPSWSYANNCWKFRNTLYTKEELLNAHE